MVRSGKTRAAHGLRDPFVEGLSLLPEMVVPLVLALRQVGAFGIEVEAGLGQDGNALLRELAQAVHGLLQEVGVIHHFVVVEEHHRVEAQHVGHHQTQVAHRTVAGQADLLLQLAQTQLLHALLDKCQLGSADDHGVQRGKARDNALNLLGRLVLDRRLADHEHDDLAGAAHLLQRRKQTRELAGLRDGSRVIVGREHAAAFFAATRGHESGDHNNGVHARPSLGYNCEGSAQPHIVAIYAPQPCQFIESVKASYLVIY